MKAVWLLTLFFTLAASAQKNQSKALGYGMSTDDLNYLVCSVVCNGKLFPDTDPFDLLLQHNYDKAHWLPIFEEEQNGINKLRLWAMKSLPDCPLRRVYLSWADDYYQSRLDKAREELRTQKKLNESKDLNRRMTDLEQSVHIPLPPFNFAPKASSTVSTPYAPASPLVDGTLSDSSVPTISVFTTGDVVVVPGYVFSVFDPVTTATLVISNPKNGQLVLQCHLKNQSTVEDCTLSKGSTLTQLGQAVLDYLQPGQTRP